MAHMPPRVAGGRFCPYIATEISAEVVTSYLIPASVQFVLKVDFG
jgi:hypothetical protein